MLPTGLVSSAELFEDLDVSDVFDLTPQAAAILAALPGDIRAVVIADLGELFRQVLEIAYSCGMGMDCLLAQTKLTL